MIAVITKPDAVVFGICALAAVLGCLGVILSRNPVHSAFALVLTLFSVAVMFVSQGADFLAAVQVIVYAGAVVVVFLFVIMLIGVDKAEKLGGEKHKYQRIFGALAAIGIAGEIIVLGRAAWVTGVNLTGPSEGENIRILARTLFSEYLVPFELTSALLVISVIGAIVLAKNSENNVIDISEMPEDLPKSQAVDAEIDEVVS